MQAFTRPAALAASLILSACPGCIVFFGKEYVPAPDPLADHFVKVKDVRGGRAVLADGREVQVAGIDVSSMPRTQQELMWAELKQWLLRCPFVAVLDEGRRGRVVMSMPYHRTPRCMGLRLNIFPVKVKVPPRRVDVALEALRRGLAKAKPEEISDQRTRRKYRQAEAWAKANKLGIWAPKDRRFLLAAEKGAKDEALRLLAEGADLAARDRHGFTALHLAAKAGHAGLVELLMRRGADASAKAQYEQTALHVAARFGRKDVVELLLRSGVPVDSESLRWAAAYGRRQMVELLLARGAKIPASAGDDSLIGSLSRGGDLGVVHLLLSKGAGMCAARHGPELLVRAVLQQRRELVALLLAKGVDPNAADCNGNRPMDAAAPNGMVEIAKLLIAHSADVNRKNKRGRRPLYLARKGKHADMAALLRKHGAR